MIALGWLNVDCLSKEIKEKDSKENTTENRRKDSKKIEEKTQKIQGRDSTQYGEKDVLILLLKCSKLIC